MSQPNLSYLQTRRADYPGAETLAAFWLTEPEAARAVSPAPLEPLELPLVMAFVARFREVSFGTPYLMGGLFMSCTYQSEVGTFVPNIVESDDLPVFMGREVLGYPKKMGVLGLASSVDRAAGFIERRGVRLFDLQADLTRRVTEPAELQGMAGMGLSSPDGKAEVKETEGMNFLFKFAHAAEAGRMFEHRPKIVRQMTTMRTRSGSIGPFTAALGTSPSDSAWSRLPLRQPLFALHSFSDNTMNPPSVVGEVEDEAASFPHSFH
jgi:hypothetical protein